MTNTTAAAAAKTAAAPIMNNCLCSQFEVVIRERILENNQPEIDTETTGCTETTAREFAPGHDAKLKSLLIRAGVAGLEVRQNLGGVVHSGAAETMASGFAFAYMVREGIERGRAKAAAKAEKKASKAAGRVTRKPAAPKRDQAAEMPRKVGARVVAAITAAEAAPEAPAAAPAIETVEIKVGRWTYLATIDAKGDAHYTTKAGDAAVAVKGIYKLV